MHFENHFHGRRSSRLLVLRRGGAGISGACKMFAERSEGAGPRSPRQIHRPVIQGPPRGSDGTRRTSSDWSWRTISAVVSVSTAKTAAVLGTCGELQLCRVLVAVVSWIFEQALDGCAAYAAAMYGMPADELRDRRDPPGELQTRHEHTDRPVSQTSGKIFTNAKANILYLAKSSAATLEAELVTTPPAPRMVSPGSMAFVRSIAAKIRSRIRQLRDRRLATAELRSFDDRSLRDIGISRCDIEYPVGQGDLRE